MAQILKEVIIPNELVCYIQRLSYEVEAHKSIVQTTIRKDNGFIYNQEIYELHMAKYLEVYKEFNLAMSELLSEYGSEFKDNFNASPKVDFIRNRLLIVDNREDRACCNK